MEKSERFTVLDNQRSNITESYRKVAANIQFANIDDNIKTIMVTSSMSSEGKTTTVSNIATVMTDANKKVLIMDLDLRKPALHKQFSISNQKGVTDLLLSKGDSKDYIISINDRLDVLTSGKIPANPSEIINSHAIKDLIKNLCDKYDYIFIDTPPVALVSDPITIATYSDAVILTIAYSETEKEVAKKSVESLKNVNANIIGTVFNKVPISSSNKYYYDYY